MSFLRAIFAPKASFGDISDPYNFLLGGGVGKRTTAGERVSPATALTLSTWLACIRNIAEDIGKLPFELYQVKTGGRTLATSHPARSIMSIAPNPEISAMTFRETLTGWALGWGNGYAEIERDAAGAPVALWPIHPWRVRIQRVNGAIVYDVYAADLISSNVKAVRLEARDVLHIRGFGDDPLCGLSTARMAAEAIGLSLAAQTFGAAFFGNGATLGLTLEHPGKLSEPAQVRLRESWAKAHAGADNAHKLSILEEGMKANRVTVPPDEAQFIESRAFQIHEIARFFRMPVHKIQMMDRATFSNIEQQSIEYVVDCLQPWMTRWEQECQRKLIDARDVDMYIVRHTVVELMRGDSTARSNYYRTMISTGVMTPNEAREMESMNRSKDPSADSLYMQGAMSTLERIVEGPPAPVAPGGAPDASAKAADKEEADPAKPAPPTGAKDSASQQAALMRPVFADAEARCRRKEESAIANAMRKHTTQAMFAPWVATFYAEHRRYLFDAFSPACVALGNSILANRPGYVADDASIGQAVEDYCSNAQRHVAATGTAFTPDQPLADTIIAIMTLEVSHA
jgi:HK97 family phage portal protein